MSRLYAFLVYLVSVLALFGYGRYAESAVATFVGAGVLYLGLMGLMISGLVKGTKSADADK